MTAEPGQASDTRARQQAVDPANSVVLEAPAGSGKTLLLVTRYLNLLGRVTRPEEILAITFTNKAATEMRERVLAELAGDSAAARAVRQLDEERGWDLANRPDRLKIQTIDSFAFMLARRQPVACEFVAAAPVEDASSLYEDAAQRLLDRMAGSDPLAEEVADFVALLDNDAERARSFLAAALGKRDQWIDAVRQTARDPDEIARRIGSGVEQLRAAVADSLHAAFDDELRAEMAEICGHAASVLDTTWSGWEDPQSWSLAAATLLTANGSARRRFTRREGFERHHANEKRSALETAAKIAAAGLAPQLALAGRLPQSPVDAATRAPLRAIATTLALAVTNLNEAFAAHEAMDFTELALAANRALALDDLPTELAQALDYRIRHVLVDEFQDTSLSQHRLLAALVDGWEAGSGNSFFAVGDPMQSIYRFRDANLRQFLTTAAHGFEQWPLRRLRLNTNFRSHERLIGWCNAVFARLFGEQTDSIHGAVAFHEAVPGLVPVPEVSQAGVHIEMCIADPDSQGQAQGEVVADRVEALLATDPEASIAVLVRARAVLDDMLPVWRRRGIAWRGTDIEPLVNEPVVRDLATLTEVLYVPHKSQPGKALAWLALLRSPLVGLEIPDLERVAQSGVSSDGEGLSAPARARWQRLGHVLAHDERALQPRARIERIWLRLGGADAYRDTVSGGECLANAEQFFELLEARPALARRPEDLRRQLARLYATTGDDIAQGQPANDPRSIEVMTIHKAKGLEFDHVIVPGLEHVPARGPSPLLLWRPEGTDVLIASRTHRGQHTLYDWLEAEEKAQDANELKRLFYVAATRAARSLNLIGAVESAEQSARPPKDSMLDLLWDIAYDDIAFKSDVLPIAERGPRTLSRLPDDYTWSPPVELPPVDQVASPPPRTPVTPLDDHRDVVLGDLVHREMKLIADRGRPDAYDVTPRLPVWERWLRPTGLPDADRSWVATQLRSQILGVAADPKGRWLLAHHEHDGREAPFTSAVDGELLHIVVDRTFVEDGTRWIVDYKSTVLAGDDDEITAQCQRHRPQLRRYARVLGELDDLPIRTALFFTAIPRLVEV
ncbi:MAG: UvrD-helicase domain-containing protein [Gammaproteobacteria bacterium]|nr:UvrD-helicase domain-containing protein [Gammaproteobacteria bacterium]